MIGEQMVVKSSDMEMEEESEQVRDFFHTFMHLYKRDLSGHVCITYTFLI